VRNYAEVYLAQLACGQQDCYTKNNLINKIDDWKMLIILLDNIVGNIVIV